MSLLRNKNFVSLYVASTVSNLGDGVASVAYPWLASAVTRNPLLVALVLVVQRLPWLVFTLPAGVITDRVDRRKAMVSMDAARGVLTVAVGLAVFSQHGHLPAPGRIPEVLVTRTLLYVVLLIATLLLGMAEVLRDNASVTIIPAFAPAISRSTSFAFVASPQSRQCWPRIHRSPGFVIGSTGGSGTSSSTTSLSSW